MRCWGPGLGRAGVEKELLAYMLPPSWPAVPLAGVAKVLVEALAGVVIVPCVVAALVVEPDVRRSGVPKEGPVWGGWSPGEGGEGVGRVPVAAAAAEAAATAAEMRRRTRAALTLGSAPSKSASSASSASTG
jgi:hypothetical protein